MDKITSKSFGDVDKHCKITVSSHAWWENEITHTSNNLSCCSADKLLFLSYTYTHTQTLIQLTADDAVLPWEAWCQVDVCPLHAAQALLLNGAPFTQVGAMNSLSRAVWRTSQNRFQLQILHLTTARKLVLTQHFGLFGWDTDSYSDFCWNSSLLLIMKVN